MRAGHGPEESGADPKDTEDLKMFQRTAGWSPQMLTGISRPSVAGSREALPHEQKQSWRF